MVMVTGQSACLEVGCSLSTTDSRHIEYHFCMDQIVFVVRRLILTKQSMAIGMVGQ